MMKFTLEKGDFIPLCDLLKRTGCCEHGGAAKAMIAEGLVSVDGEVELRKRCKIRVNQIVEFQGEKIEVIKLQKEVLK